MKKLEVDEWLLLYWIKYKYKKWNYSLTIITFVKDDGIDKRTFRLRNKY